MKTLLPVLLLTLPVLAAPAPETRLRTAHLDVRSHLDEEETKRLAGLLEEQVGSYRKAHEGIWKLASPKAPVAVRLFQDREGFEISLVSEGGFQGPVAPQVAGYYAHGPRTLFVGPGECADHGAVHEMTHALDHVLAGFPQNAPLWLKEGRAEYWAYAAIAAGDDDPVLDRASEAAQAPDLAGLVAADRKTFMLDPDRNYALSFAFVHFLYHGEKGRHAAGFRKFLAGVPKGRASRADLEKCLGRAAASLEAAFASYVREELPGNLRR